MSVQPRPIPAIQPTASLGGWVRRRSAFCAGLIMACLVLFSLPVRSQSFVTLHSFSGSDGAYANSTLIEASDGNLYGTTPYGGANGIGTVFTVSLALSDIISLSPSSEPANTAFTLTVSGTGFIPGSIVEWNGNPLRTTYHTASDLTASVTTTDNKPLSAYPGSARVSVVNPDKTSVNTYLTITVPEPILKSISPAFLPAGGKATTLILTGDTFALGAVVNWNGSVLPTSVVTTNKLSASVPASDLVTPGTARVNVTNPGGGGSSNTLTVPILSVPTLTLVLGTPSRDANGNLQVPITLANMGSGAANSLQIGSALLGGSQTTTSLPLELGSVGAGSSADATLSFAGSAGGTGQKVKLTVKGTYQVSGATGNMDYALAVTLTLP